MTLLAILNDLSYPCPVRSKSEADAIVEGLIDLLRRVKSEGPNLALMTAEPLLGLQVAEGVALGAWGRSGRDLERVRYLRTLQSRTPFAAPISENDSSLVEYRWYGSLTEGLGLADAYDSLCVSFTYAGSWDTALVPLERTSLEESDSGDVEAVTRDVKVRHASSRSHIDGHRAWLVERETGDLLTGAQLWRERESVFDRLRFLPSVENQVLGLEPAVVGPVRTCLMELNEAAKDWRPDVGKAPAWRTKVTGEGETRKRLCYFKDLDGELRLFDYHARFTPTAGRIHLRLDAAERVLVIAHIGQKLGI